MDPIYKIEKSTHLGSVRTFLKAFLKTQEDRALLVPLRSENTNTVMPSLVTDPDLLDQADPFSPAFPMNSAKLVSKLTRKSSGEPMAAFLRPCEVRAFVELVKIKQANWDNLIIISSDCAGAFSNRDFREKAMDGKEKFTRDFLDKRLGSNLSDTMDDSIATACTICTRPFPETADITLGLFHPGNKGITLTGTSEKGAKILEAMTLETIEAGEDNKDKSQVISARKSHEKQVFQKLEAQTGTLPDLGQYLSNCINCYNCRVACPVCFCKECVFNTDVVDYEPFQYQGWARAKGGLKMPTDTMFFHITRMIHMGLSCVGCGQCSNACPNDIPLAQLFKLVGEKAQKGFSYIPGKDVDEAPPLSVFMENEFQDITGIS
ncbi:formate dehydrogenase subunit beta [Desulfocicer vacuolatum DSM 3385]|uniref:Formate dehydrogenase subunit beta n=1 Tax=Desulfocicer vacuolatum DSM 3385 TaxID=1121400 RepID=A0A1W2AJR9_9BACT|nr:Coenzyme F420 hydrogenase/dehydrogenase, beta subunit C-terminal domain [Desulfocicer vacuolatum]SMC60762.1 formate dehydrogenase subunit beta [Desulfocicer vacuolatum DSM 3385]